MTAIEIGHRPVSAAELLLLPTLLRAPLTELVFADKDEVADVDGVLVTNVALNQIARGRPPEEQESQFFVTPPRVEAGAAEAERKAAKSLGGDQLDDHVDRLDRNGSGAMGRSALRRRA